MSKKEIYISIDVETDGPIPGEYSMLSLGAAAFIPSLNTHGYQELGQYSVNLTTLPGAKQNPDTMDWWGSQPEAWKACREEPCDPTVTMQCFVDWIHHMAEKYDAKPVCVAYPSGFDFLFVYWYLIKFTGKSPFSFSAIDIKTYAMAMLKKGYRECTKKHMPKHWFSEAPHTHKAVDDAIEQGQLFMYMLKENNQ